ncbi:hypothetical protein AAFF_G00100070 [Aldrovandia affinis]|uniref:Uncharacterized protein n=1 Tax=Aldrovandia affinis TaxID=143900 RepID=A0AAD7RV91_9TELE|nr:hypothetical protein AAFF_G00100070 [Aldrovandia affinis]
MPSLDEPTCCPCPPPFYVLAVSKTQGCVSTDPPQIHLICEREPQVFLQAGDYTPVRVQLSKQDAVRGSRLFRAVFMWHRSRSGAWPEQQCRESAFLQDVDGTALRSGGSVALWPRPPTQQGLTLARLTEAERGNNRHDYGKELTVATVSARNGAVGEKGKRPSLRFPPEGPSRAVGPESTLGNAVSLSSWVRADGAHTPSSSSIPGQRESQSCSHSEVLRFLTRHAPHISMVIPAPRPGPHN